MAPAADRDSVKLQLASTRAALAKAGISYAWLDAEILVAHVLHVSRERLHSHPEQRLTQPQRRRLRRLAGPVFATEESQHGFADAGARRC